MLLCHQEIVVIRCESFRRLQVTSLCLPTRLTTRIAPQQTQPRTANMNATMQRSSVVRLQYPTALQCGLHRRMRAHFAGCRAFRRRMRLHASSLVQSGPQCHAVFSVLRPTSACRRSRRCATLLVGIDSQSRSQQSNSACTVTQRPY